MILMILIALGALGDRGDATLRAPAFDSEIVVKTTSRVAGAIDSLTFRGKEYVDSADHGRQIQSAANFDCGKALEPELFNPTEAGSVEDGAGALSTSRLLDFKVRGNTLHAVNQPAFWLAPGGKSEGREAWNTEPLSKHRIEKTVVVGLPEAPNALRFDIGFEVPAGEGHTLAQFEALTGYMPDEFQAFWRYDTRKRAFEALDAGPGEQAAPVAISTIDKQHAMAVYSPDQPSGGFENLGYGRFRFMVEKVNKWNCVFRVRDPKGIKPGKYGYRIYVLVGTLDEVERALGAVIETSRRESRR